MLAPVSYESDFSHLSMKVAPKARCNYQIRQVAAKILTPGITRILHKLTNIEQAARLTRELQDAKRAAPNMSPSYREGFVFDNSLKEMQCGEHYRQELLAGDWTRQQTESGDLYAAVIPLAAEIIRSRQISSVLNFGVSYAHIDNELARQFPATLFTGVGRSPLTRFFNEQFFALPNLQFESADIGEVLSRRSWKGSLLLHTRTLSSLLPAYVERLYRQAAQAGVEHVVLAEQCGLSWETGRPYEFSLAPQPSVALRNYMYIHNYPGLLHAAGYRIRYSTLLKTRHPDPNFRLVVIAAGRS